MTYSRFLSSKYPYCILVGQALGLRLPLRPPRQPFHHLQTNPPVVIRALPSPDQTSVPVVLSLPRRAIRLQFRVPLAVDPVHDLGFNVFPSPPGRQTKPLLPGDLPRIIKADDSLRLSPPMFVRIDQPAVRCLVEQATVLIQPFLVNRL